jgi:hypothetical protein
LRRFDVRAFLSHGNLWFLIPVAACSWQVMYYNTFIFQMLRRHVAITNRGIYLDDVDKPKSVRVVVRRQIIELDSIVGCHVVIAGGCCPTYQAVVKVKVDHGLYAMEKDRAIPGLIEAHADAPRSVYDWRPTLCRHFDINHPIETTRDCGNNAGLRGLTCILPAIRRQILLARAKLCGALDAE